MTEIEKLRQELKDSRETILGLKRVIDEMHVKNLLRVVKNVCKACGHDKTEDGCPWCLTHKHKKKL